MRFSIRLLALFVLLVPGIVQAQSAAEVLRNVYEQSQEQLDDVDTYIATVTMDGPMQAFDSMKVYVRKGEGDAMFDTQTKAFGGMAAQINQQQASPAGDLLAVNRKLYELFGETATHEGTDQINGSTVHVIGIEDATPLYAAMMPDEEAVTEHMQARNARLYIDAERWVPLKIEMDMEIADENGDETRTLHATTEMQDYRQVGPLYYPFRIVSTTTSPLTEEERRQMAASREQMRQQLDQLPEAQRKRLEEMLNMSEGFMQGDLVITMQTQNLEVNVPIPDGVFPE